MTLMPLAAAFCSVGPSVVPSIDAMTRTFALSLIAVSICEICVSFLLSAYWS